MRHWRTFADGAIHQALTGDPSLHIAVAAPSGRHVRSPARADVRPLAFYAGGFFLAGALLGMARPLLRTRVAIYAGCAGTLVMVAIVIRDS